MIIEPRDTRMSKDHWDSIALTLGKYLRSERDRKVYEEALEDGKSNSPIYAFSRKAVSYYMESINYLYSRGNSLDELRSGTLATALSNALFVQKEFDAERQKIDVREIFYNLSRPNGLHSVYAVLSWCVCLDVDVGTMRQLARTLAEAGTDRLVDTVLSRYDPDRIVASRCAAPKVFGLLAQVIDADESKRVTLMVKYLDGWAKRMAMLKGLNSWGGTTGTMGAKSNKDLENKDRLSESYMGWWAWEVALVVRVLGIDDSSFADHVLYPVDLARYRSREQPVDLWPIEVEPKDVGSAGTRLEQPEENGMIAELLVALDLAVNAASPVKAAELQLGPDIEEEYYLYVAVEKNTGVHQEDPLIVNMHVTDFFYTASVTESVSALEIASENIERVTGYLEDHYDNYPYHRDNLDDGDTKALLDHLDVQFVGTSRGIYLPIASGPDWATWIDASEYKEGRFITAVEYARIDNGKLLSIRGANSGRPGLAVGEFVRYWEKLVEKYGGRKL